MLLTREDLEKSKSSSPWLFVPEVRKVHLQNAVIDEMLHLRSVSAWCKFGAASLKDGRFSFIPVIPC